MYRCLEASSEALNDSSQLRDCQRVHDLFSGTRGSFPNEKYGYAHCSMASGSHPSSEVGRRRR